MFQKVSHPPTFFQCVCGKLTHSRSSRQIQQQKWFRGQQLLHFTRFFQLKGFVHDSFCHIWWRLHSWAKEVLKTSSGCQVMKSQVCSWLQDELRPVCLNSTSMQMEEECWEGLAVWKNQFSLRNAFDTWVGSWSWLPVSFSVSSKQRWLWMCFWQNQTSRKQHACSSKTGANHTERASVRLEIPSPQPSPFCMCTEVWIDRAPLSRQHTQRLSTTLSSTHLPIQFVLVHCHPVCRKNLLYRCCT